MEIVAQLTINSITTGSIYALLAIGFTLTYGATKFFNMAHGVVAVTGAYGVLYASHSLELPLWVAVIFGLAVAGFVGLLSDKFIFNQLRKRKATNMVLLVASIGLFVALQSLIAIFFTSRFHTLRLPSLDVQTFNVLGATVTSIQLWIFAAVTLTTLGIWALLKFTLFGKSIKAISDDEEVAKIVGINTNVIIGWVFFVGSAVAGLGAILRGYDTGIEPTSGLLLLLGGIIGATVGGMGRLMGAVLGAFILGFAENFGIWFVSGEWKATIAFAVLIIFLIFRPQGIFAD